MQNQLFAPRSQDEPTPKLQVYTEQLENISLGQVPWEGCDTGRKAGLVADQSWAKPVASLLIWPSKQAELEQEWV